MERGSRRAPSSRPLGERFRQLDLFPKILDECQETSSSGGMVALITFTILALLVLSELTHVRGIDRVFEYEVDNSKTFSSLSINIDIDINTPCERVWLH